MANNHLDLRLSRWALIFASLYQVAKRDSSEILRDQRNGFRGFRGFILALSAIWGVYRVQYSPKQEF